MSTAHDRRSVSKHRAILDAAKTLFLREGYSRTSMNAIAAASGVSKQTLYAHFEAKQQLFLAVVEQVRNANGVGPGTLPRLISDTGDAHHDLRTAGVRLLRAILTPEHMALHRLTIAELTHHPELQRAWRDEMGTPDAVSVIATYLAACHRQGHLVVPDPDLAARQFVMLLSVEGQVRSLRGVEQLSDDDVHAIADATTDLILRAHRS